MSKYAYLVRQMHFNAPFIYGMGPIVGARTRRVAMRHAVEGFIATGVPAERMGLLLGFQSGPGKGGREGLEPRASWFEIIKQDALAARQVTGELGLSSVWSWGWGTFDEAGADADKPAAACVYLWTRDPTLCDGLRAAGPRFNSSLTLGQIILPAGVQCKTGVGRITEAAVEQLETVTGNRQSALTALLNRLIYAHERVTVSSDEIDHVLTSLIERGFAGDSVAYQAALTQAGVTPPLARTLVADQLRRQEFEAIVQVRYATSSPGGFRDQRQRDLLRKTICLRDELPGPGVIDWAQEVPFLAVRPGSVSIRATRYQVRKGTPVVLSGRVESELPAEVVTVYGRKAGARRLHDPRHRAARCRRTLEPPREAVARHDALQGRFEKRRELRHRGSGSRDALGRKGEAAAADAAGGREVASGRRPRSHLPGRFRRRCTPSP